MDQVRALLDPLLSRKRLHYLELDALCQAHIELFVAKDQPDIARSWLGMWADSNPENPAFAYWQARLGKVKGR